MKIKSFPHAVEALAAWRGKIYKNTTTKQVNGKEKTYDHFRLVYYAGDGRKTLGFDSLPAVVKGIDDLLDKLGASEGGSVILGGNEAVLYRQTQQSLAQLDPAPALNIAVADYVEARKLIGEVSMKEAARFYAEHNGLNLTDKTVPEIVAELLAEKRNTLSERHVDDLESRLNRFAKDFPVRMSTLSRSQVRTWIGGLRGVRGQSKTATPRPLSVRSRNNYLLAIQNLISFAKEKEYLSKKWELELGPTKERKQDISIFTPDEVSKLLTHANTKLLPFVALSAFAGIRSAELERLDWSKVDLAEGQITIDASVAKTNSRRVVPIQPNLKAWLRPVVKMQGRVCAYENVTNELLKLSIAAGVEWKRNGLRHSYGSYRTAKTADLPRVSFEMGNSPAMIKRHYLELANEKQADAYFAVKPKRQKKATRTQPSNVVTLPSQVDNQRTAATSR